MYAHAHKLSTAADPAICGRRVRVGWLALLALATLQFAVAQHSTAHEIEDLAESCEVCIKLDDNLPVTGHAPSSVAVPLEDAAVLTPAVELIVARYPRDGESRAPPKS